MQQPAQDEYQAEIRDLRRTLARLHEREAEPDLIDEYEVELRVHTALYQAAQVTLSDGRRDRALQAALRALGYGEWTLDNVYSFVYDVAMELPDTGRELAAHIDDLDFVGSLRETQPAP